MSKILTVPESCNQCRYNPFVGTCMKHDCKDCPMGCNSLCRCLSMTKGSVCTFAEYEREDTCPICGEKYSFFENIYGSRLTGHRVGLMIWDRTGGKKDQSTQFVCVCPTCGEQLKKCMEENPQ